MISDLIHEAKLIGFKEGFKVAIVWLVFYSYLLSHDRRSLIKPFYSGITLVSIISIFSFFFPFGMAVKDYLSNIITMSFAVLLILSAASLLHVSGTNLLGKTYGIKSTAFLNITVFLGTLVFFSPDSIGSIFFLKELGVMRGSELMTYLHALIGLLVAVSIFFGIVILYRPYWIGSFFDFPQLLLFLAIVKLLGSGIKGVAELSLIPSVQRGFMKFTHDVIHQMFVMMMVPDHPLLKTTAWNFIAIFFGPKLASVASLIILLFFPFMFIYQSLFKPLPEPEAEKKAQKRKIKALLLSDRRKKALPVIFFVSLILIAWFSQTGEQVTQLYNPKPMPVVEDKGVIRIPLNDPTMDLMDGSVHKFSLLYEGEEIRILIIKKPNNSLAVCLDACEICPPDGYAQREDHVICIFCGTPIPVDTLGEAGGCNPIPLAAVINGRFVEIELKEILKKWGFVKTGEGKETIK